MLLNRLVADLLPRMPLWARTVLDVGCGDGDLAAAYRPLNPGARILGTGGPGDGGPALDGFSPADPATDPMPFDVADGIDCIVYRGVLERLSDPWALVRAQARTLSRDGVMLLCLPNGDHWRIADSMLRGVPDLYAKDRPGEAFAPATVRRQLARAGLSVCDALGHVDDPEGAERFALAMAPALSSLGVDPADYVKRSAPGHMIWRVRKEPRERMIVSGNMLEPVGGVSHVRVVHPLRALASDPSVLAELRDRLDAAPPEDAVPRIFVLHRPALFGPDGRNALRRLAEAGYVIVTEFDDHPDHFPMMRMGGDLGFRGAHALQTSTAALADVLRAYNPELAVFPNALQTLPRASNFADPDVLTLFFGALNREADWVRLMPAINRAARLAGPRLRFQVIHDRGFFDALDTPHKHFTPTCDYDTYLRILGGCEIGFMPLGDTPFNRCKSDLKFIEAAGCRLAALASTVVYGDSVRHGRTGLLFRDPVEFERHLLSLVAMPELARRLGDAAREYVARERMLAYQVAPRIAWYRSLWQKRAMLDALRQERLAG
jgi:SAM-dependent methyltransferase